MDALAPYICYSLFKNIPFKTLKAIGISNRHLYKCFSNYKNQHMQRKGGNTILYPHQIELIDTVKHDWESGKRTTSLQADMSWGKTLAGLQILFESMDSYGIYVAPPTMLRSLILEAEKHYGTSRDISDRKILFYSSTRSADRIYIDNCLVNEDVYGLFGKVIVLTPSLKWKDKRDSYNTLINWCHHFVFDEAHTMKKAYERLADHFTKNRPWVRMLYMSATEMKVKTDGKNTSKLNDTMMPNVSSELIVTNDVETVTNDRLDRDTGRIVVVHESREQRIGLVIPVLNFFNRQATSYKKFNQNENKLALETSIKAVCTGNNLNMASSMYIINPLGCAMPTIQQCIGRMYRQSNNHSAVRYTVVVPKYDKTWVYCRVALIIPKFDHIVTKDVTSVENVVSFLKAACIDLDALTDHQVILLFCRLTDQTTMFDTTHNYWSSLPTSDTISTQLLLTCMML